MALNLVNYEAFGPVVAIYFIRMNLESFLKFHKPPLIFYTLNGSLGFLFRRIHSNQEFGVIDAFRHFFNKPKQMNLIVRVRSPP